MFLHLLSENNKNLFLEIAYLVSISDNPLLWDGRVEAELTGDADLQNIAVKEVEQEKVVLIQFARECGKSIDDGSGLISAFRRAYVFSEQCEKVWIALKERLRPLPLRKQSDRGERINASCAVLEKFYSEKNGAEFLPAEPKVMLYELFMLALADGEISSVEDALLRKFADLFQIEEFLYDDLLESAQGMNREVVKTVSMILE